MLNYYKWLFNVNEDEERKEEVRSSVVLVTILRLLVSNS